MKNIKIVYPEERLFESFREALHSVAAEKIYIEMIEAPPLDKVRKFQTELIQKNGAVYYALDGDRVVGWCDVFPFVNPRQAHRGGLGMGIIEGYRGQGIGSKLIEAVIAHAKNTGLEKIELSVYSENIAAIALYKKFGFVEHGFTKNYRKLDDKYFHCVHMELFL